MVINAILIGATIFAIYTESLAGNHLRGIRKYASERERKYTFHCCEEAMAYGCFCCSTFELLQILVFLISGNSRPFKDPVLEFPEHVIKSNFNNYKLKVSIA